MARRAPRAVEHLESDEAGFVLRSLLKRHPELAKEAESSAKRVMLGFVSPEAIADEVKRALEAADDIDNLNGRAGSFAGGYVDPSEAACAICDEAVERFGADMKRRLALGDHAGAMALCQGAVCGLYQMRRRQDGVIGWAGEDWLPEQAGCLIEAIMSGRPFEANDLRAFSAFFHGKTPQWFSWIKELLDRAQKRSRSQKGK